MRISDWSSDVCSSDLDLTSGSGQDLRPGGSTCAYRRCAVSLELQSCSDGELAALTLGGRQAAFAEIMHRHQSAIFRLVRGLVGNAEEALDLTQDCFVSAFSHLRKYDGARPLRAWLPRIAIKKIGRASGRERVCQYV